MAPKKQAAAAVAKKSAAAPTHSSYRGMYTLLLLHTEVSQCIASHVIRMRERWLTRSCRHDQGGHPGCEYTPTAIVDVVCPGSHLIPRCARNKAATTHVCSDQRTVGTDSSCHNLAEGTQWIEVCRSSHAWQLAVAGAVLYFLHTILADWHPFRSRQSLKKYIQGNLAKGGATGATFDAQFNKAIKSGVEKGEFTQPKGTLLPSHLTYSIYFVLLLSRVVVWYPTTVDGLTPGVECATRHVPLPRPIVSGHSANTTQAPPVQ